VSESFHIVWAPLAIRDLDAIVEYIAFRETPDAATTVYLKIQERVETLATHPLRCRVVPELYAVGVDGYREPVISPSRIFYESRRVRSASLESWMDVGISQPFWSIERSGSEPSTSGNTRGTSCLAQRDNTGSGQHGEST